MNRIGELANNGLSANRLTSNCGGHMLAWLAREHGYLYIRMNIKKNILVKYILSMRELTAQRASELRERE